MTTPAETPDRQQHRQMQEEAHAALLERQAAQMETAEADRKATEARLAREGR